MTMFAKSSFATFVPIKNMNRAIRFYTEALGGKVVYRGEGDMKNMFAILKLAGTEFWLITPDSREKRTLAYSVFIVKNIASAVKELQGKGVKFEPAERNEQTKRVKGPIAYDDYGASAFFKDSEGNMQMIWQTGKM